MNDAGEWLLVAGVAVVGVLHTAVPDHWMPIALIARQRGWSTGETAWAAVQAGIGHVGSTLLLGVAVWFGGAAFATQLGGLVDYAASAALIGFGGWIALAALAELRRGRALRHDPGHHHNGPHGHAHRHHHHLADWHSDPLYLPAGGDAAVLTRHIHVHRHGRGPAHLHWHDHFPASAHELSAVVAADPPLHAHRHRMTTRTALVVILGSSPMIEGIPAFFAAGRCGAALIGVMAGAFAAATIGTYVALCVTAGRGLQQLRLGRLERYGEALSGAFIAAIGVAFWVWPIG